MSRSDETEATDTTQGIGDDQLPDDLNPDENPMAAGLDDGESVDDLLTDGKDAEESEESDESQDGDDGES